MILLRICSELLARFPLDFTGELPTEFASLLRLLPELILKGACTFSCILRVTDTRVSFSEQAGKDCDHY